MEENIRTIGINDNASYIDYILIRKDNIYKSYQGFGRINSSGYLYYTKILYNDFLLKTDFVNFVNDESKKLMHRIEGCCNNSLFLNYISGDIKLKLSKYNIKYDTHLNTEHKDLIKGVINDCSFNSSKVVCYKRFFKDIKSLKNMGMKLSGLDLLKSLAYLAYDMNDYDFEVRGNAAILLFQILYFTTKNKCIFIKYFLELSYALIDNLSHNKDCINHSFYVQNFIYELIELFKNNLKKEDRFFELSEKDISQVNKFCIYYKNKFSKLLQFN
jgi:hypothetical protein